MKKILTYLTSGVLASLSLVSLAVPASAAQPDEVQEESSSVIVQLQEDVESPRQMAQSYVSSCDCELQHVYEHAFKGFAVKVKSGSFATVMKENDSVKKLHMDRRYKLIGRGTIGIQSDQSDQEANASTEDPKGVNRVKADEVTSDVAEGVNVAVIDSGVEKDHPDLQNSLKGGKSFVTDDPDNWTDEFGHGTHVAGTIAADENGQGVEGVAPNANLYSARVLTKKSGGMKEIAAAVDWTASPETNIDVANMSLGGPAFFGEDLMHDAVKGAVENGVTIAVAAGNDSDDSKNYVPAKFDEVITVSALADSDGKPGGKGPKLDLGEKAEPMPDDSLATFSNYGKSVDVTAPGVKTKSTWIDGGYKKISGTSMASPHVAGVIALLVGENESLSHEKVEDVLRSKGMDAPSGGWTNDPDNKDEPVVNAKKAANYSNNGGGSDKPGEGEEDEDDSCGWPPCASSNQVSE